MELRVISHPLVDHKLTVLRDRNTEQPIFRRLVEELVTLLAYEATRGVRVHETAIETPVAPTVGTKLDSPAPLVVPILRAGLGMLDGMLRLVPTAEVGFLGMIRDEKTLEPTTYAERLPQDLSGRQCYVLDPMLATGGSLGEAVKFLVGRGADDITCICLLAAPEGIERIQDLLADLDVPCTLVVSAVDERLNDGGFIVRGLGVAGDRLSGLADLFLAPRPARRPGSAVLTGQLGRALRCGLRDGLAILVAGLGVDVDLPVGEFLEGVGAHLVVAPVHHTTDVVVEHTLRVRGTALLLDHLDDSRLDGVLARFPAAPDRAKSNGDRGQDCHRPLEHPRVHVVRFPSSARLSADTKQGNGSPGHPGNRSR